MGAELNAATSREHTVVYSRVPDRHVEEAIASDDRHGLRACVRRARPGARGRARGDRDVRGHAAGARARPLLPGRVRLARARPAGDRYRRGHLDDQPPRDRRLPPFDVHRREHRRRAAGNITHERLSRCWSASTADARPRRPRVRRPLVAEPPAGLRFQRKDTEQYHLCLGAPGISRSDRRRFAASLLDSILGGSRRPGSSRRSARSGGWRTPSTASRRSTRTRASSASTSARERRTCAVRRDRVEQIADDRGGKSARRRARARKGESEGADHAVDGVDVEPDDAARQVGHLRHRAA